jgi:hypothetical protein
MSMVINRKHRRVQELLYHVSHIIEAHLPPNFDRRALYRELEDLFYATGPQIITEAMRIEAGLPIRDDNGMTIEEIRIFEARLLAAQAAAVMPNTVFMAECPKCGFKEPIGLGLQKPVDPDPGGK